MRISTTAALVSILGLWTLACGGADAPTQESGVFGADDGNVGAEGDTGEDGLSASDRDSTDPGEGENGEDQGAIGDVFADGSQVETTANLNLRSGPSTAKSVLRTMPNGSEVTVVDGTAQNGFIKISQNGLEGYSAYRYLQGAAGGSSPSSGSAPSGSRAAAVAVAQSQVGLSYWWGHGRFVSGAVTSSNRGRCAGLCPGCSHSGASNGADCSGFVAKVWGVPSSNSNLTSDNHPYSTADFYGGTGSGKWATVSKSALQAGDAMVYRSGNSGHVFLYEKGDAWGQPWAYEARGCAYGVVHNVRSAGSKFKAIKRTGF